MKQLRMLLVDCQTGHELQEVALGKACRLLFPVYSYYLLSVNNRVGNSDLDTLVCSTMTFVAPLPEVDPILWTGIGAC